jgi:hypothetical protein
LALEVEDMAFVALALALALDKAFVALALALALDK